MCDYHAVWVPRGADGRPRSPRIKQINAESEGNRVRAIFLFEDRTPEVVRGQGVQTSLPPCCVWGRCVSQTHSVQMKQKLLKRRPRPPDLLVCPLWTQTKRENFPWSPSLQPDLNTEKTLCSPPLSVWRQPTLLEDVRCYLEDCRRLFV